MKIANNILELIGKTPLVCMNSLGKDLPGQLVGKLEFYNPCASVKDRISIAMMDAAEELKLVKPDTTIVEPTSGNTGIGLAFVCAVRGYKLILTMPESMSMERRKLLAGFGAKLVLTDAKKGMKGAIAEAERLVKEIGNAYMPQQFKNPSVPRIHEETTGMEIWNDTEGKVDIFVAGVGTGGTVTGVGRALKKHNPDVKIVAVEPAKSPVLSGGSAGPHGIQGIGAGFVPEVMDISVVDEIMQVDDSDALSTARRLITEEGILCGISSGANAFAAMEIAARPENKGKMIVFIVCDTGERYLSTALYEEK